MVRLISCWNEGFPALRSLGPGQLGNFEFLSREKTSKVVNYDKNFSDSTAQPILCPDRKRRRDANYREYGGRQHHTQSGSSQAVGAYGTMDWEESLRQAASWFARLTCDDALGSVFALEVDDVAYNGVDRGLVVESAHTWVDNGQEMPSLFRLLCQCATLGVVESVWFIEYLHLFCFLNKTLTRNLFRFSKSNWVNKLW